MPAAASAERRNTTWFISSVAISWAYPLMVLVENGTTVEVDFTVTVPAGVPSPPVVSTPLPTSPVPVKARM